MIARKRPRGNARKKISAGSDEDHDKSAVAQAAPPSERDPERAKKRKKKDKKKDKTKGSLLSFGDEADEATSTTLGRPANPSFAKVKKVKAPALRVRAEEDAQPSASAGMYSTEALQALQQSSFQYGGGHVPIAKLDEVTLVAGGEGLPPLADGEGTEGGSIPDGDMIRAARERRERARKKDDYISLNSRDDKQSDEEDADPGSSEGEDIVGGDNVNDRVAFRGQDRRSLAAAGKRAAVEAALRDGADLYQGDNEVTERIPFYSPPLCWAPESCLADQWVARCQLRHMEAEMVKNASRGLGVMSSVGRTGLDLRDTSRGRLGSYMEVRCATA
jgi:hypothetical protein